MSVTGIAASGSSAYQSPADQARLRELQKRDAEVKRHELAHQITGGRYAGIATYKREQGPDGKTYAVGGEVSIDISPVKGDPQATIAKMRTVISAALAPADPSSQDRSVAAEAAIRLQQATLELNREKSTATPAYQSDVSPGLKLDVTA